MTMAATPVAFERRVVFPFASALAFIKECSRTRSISIACSWVIATKRTRSPGRLSAVECFRAPRVGAKHSNAPHQRETATT